MEEQWAVILKRGPKAELTWTDNRRRAFQRQRALEDLHNATSVVDEATKKIVVDASKCYTR